MASDPVADETFEAARAAVMRLREAGHETYLAGGCVRDRLRGRTPKDYDVATAATPDQVESLFKRSVAVGKAFGVIRVLCRGAWFEVATFRKDGSYADGRRPESVAFSSAEEDARRRDFTVNGLFLDPISGEITDFVGGRADLAAGVLRAIGDPETRFAEDSLRLLRAVRFAAREGFVIEPATRTALEKRRGDLRGTAPERIREELLKIATAGAEGRATGVRLLFATGLAPGVFGDLAEAVRSARAEEVVARCSTPGLPLFLAGVLGEAAETGRTTPQMRRYAERVADRLRLSNDEAAELTALLADRRRARGLARATPARRRLFATRADYERFRDLLLAEGGADAVVADLDLLRRRLGPTRPAPLLDGGALQRLGAPKGPGLGALMRRLRVLQLGERLTTVAEAEQTAKKRLRGG
jgi:poly(A) polymerase